MNFTNTFFDGLLHLVYPQTCAGCGSDLIAQGQIICSDCILNLPFTNFHQSQSNPVEKLFAGRLNLYSATSFLYFTKGSAIQRLLHQLKYNGRRGVGIDLGRMMGSALKESNWFNKVNVIVPLPLHKRRERRRGYNQASVICEGIAQSMQAHVLNNVLGRKVNTRTQTKMNRIDRWQNIKDRFEVMDSKLLQDKHVMLVDDVVTTGATLEACGATMLNIPGLKLSIATLAYATL